MAGRTEYTKAGLFLPYRNIPVLLYHKVLPPGQTTRGPDEVTRDVFENHMMFLANRGFRTVTIPELSESGLKPGKEPGKCVAITFDDGYLDNFTEAYPILRAFNFTATVFVIRDYIGKRIHRNQEIEQFLAIDQMRDMQKGGLSFQSHTCTHPDLTKVDKQSAMNDLETSRKSLEDLLGCPVRHLAYPFGHYDDRVMGWTRDAGYESAFGAGMTRMEPYCRERFIMENHDRGFALSVKTSVRGSWIRRISHKGRKILSF